MLLVLIGPVIILDVYVDWGFVKFVRHTYP
jgi:hypothetical protein